MTKTWLRPVIIIAVLLLGLSAIGGARAEVGPTGAVVTDITKRNGQCCLCR